ncbi:MAG: sialidase family protein [Gaiellaceae bacterium]
MGDLQHPTTYFPRGSDACPNNQQSNIKVNQNCLNLSDPDLQGRGQAQNEESIAVDPNNTNHLVASYNDYRRGDGTCGVSYSSDGGRTWNDSTVPNNFTRNPTAGFGPRTYWQGGGDTSVAFDSKGNAYLSCQLFQRGPGTAADTPDQSSGFFVFRSTQNGGASWNFTGRPVFETGVQRSFLPLEDKQFMAVDNNSNSCAGSPSTANPGSTCTPFQDRIYVTWTEFAPDGTAFIYEAYSADYGEHFSPRHLVSLNSNVLCANDYGLGTADRCNENQFSQPFVGPDGVLYVIYGNFNNPETLGATPDNRNQILLAKSLDGGNTFTAACEGLGLLRPARLRDVPAGSRLRPRMRAGEGPDGELDLPRDDLGSGAVNPTNPSQVVVTFGSYINRHSNESNGCAPAGISPATGQDLYTGVKTPGACNNDILVSVSNDGGNTFTGTTTDPRALPSANTDPGQATTDQWWQWIAFTKNGKLATSYYDRQYGTDELTGYSDFTLSASSDTPAYAGWNTFRITNSSMPVPTQFPESNGFSSFWGDCTGLAADTLAHPFWSDTRDPDLFACPGATAGTIASPPSVCGATVPTGTAAESGLPSSQVVNDQNAYTANQSVSATK